MKKLICIALVLVMTFALAVTCFAATPITSANGSHSGNVTATYNTPDAAGTVYKVDVVFGEMSFIYTPEGNGTWDTENHQYVEKAPAKWEATGNTIDVTNHSNAAVTVELSYAKETGYEDVTATFSQNNFELKSADEQNKATTGSATLTLGGSLPSSATTATKIGTVTVTLS